MSTRPTFSAARRLFRQPTPFAALAFLLAAPALGHAQVASTTTALSASATAVNAGTPITLSATVRTASASPVTAGQVGICDVNLTPRCEYPEFVSVAQLNGSGVATLTFRPAAGQHSYRAYFLSTTAAAASFSSAQLTVQVNATTPTTTSLTANGNSLVATVTGSGLNAVPTGTVSFSDSSNGNAASGSASLLPATSQKTFNTSGSPLLLSSTGTPEAIATGDFNNDGFLDVVEITRDAGTRTTTGTFTLLLGDGKGNFTPVFTQATSSGTTQQKIVVGDFNHDGLLDCAFFGTDYEYVLIGDGKGGFPRQDYRSDNMGNAVNFIGVGDFNDDGYPDALGLTLSASTVYFYPGQTDGTFGFYGSSISLGSGRVTGIAIPGYFLAANGSDPYMDVVLPGTLGGKPGFWTVISNGDSTFQTPIWTAAGTGTVKSAVAGDFNSDGFEDVALLDSTGNVTVMLGSSTGFTQGTTFAAGQTGGLIVADMNQDGNADLVAYGSNGPVVFYGDGAGNFPSSVTSSTSQSGIGAFVAAADVDGDGLPDLLAMESVGGAGSYLLAEPSVFTDVASTAPYTLYPQGSGSHAIVANFPGDTNFQASSSQPVNVSGSTLTDTLTVSNVTIQQGQATAGLTATVTWTGQNPPTGSLFFSVNGGAAVQANCGLSGASSATCTATYATGSLAAGTYTIAANTTADSNYPALSANGVLTVNAASTDSVTVPAQTYTPGDANTTLTALVQYNGDRPTGAVVFQVDSNQALNAACNVTNATTESCSVSYPTQGLSGSHKLTVTVLGDSRYGATSGTGTLTAGSTRPSVTITVQNATIPAGTAATTLYLSGTFQAGVFPTGTAIVMVDGANAQNAGCSITSASSATCSVNYPTGSLAAGVHSITAILQGDANYSTSTGSGQLIVQ